VQKEGTSPLTGHTFIENRMLWQLSEKNPMALQELVETYFPLLCQFAERIVPDSHPLFH
jgi:hypothetical protein